MAERLGALLSCLDPRRPAAVLTHDYPDIDAVASAWALAALLRAQGRDAACFRRGETRSRSLGRLVEELGIEIGDASGDVEGDGREGARRQLVVVDGSPANGNVSLPDGDLAAVIDHHRSVGETRVPFLDLRPGIASCSTMITGYWKEAGSALPGDMATALLAGIQSDSGFLSGRVSEEDLEAYASLYREGDWELARDIVLGVMDHRELELASAALAGAEAREGLLFVYAEGECGQEALAVTAEFALRAEGISVAVAAAPLEGGIHISARSRRRGLSAFDLVVAARAGIGSGGGHDHAAGGELKAAANPGPRAIGERFFAAAEAVRSRLES